MARLPEPRGFKDDPRWFGAMDIEIPSSTPLALDSAHVVQFYQTDEYLADVVSEFVADGIAAHEAVVVIATRAHRESFVVRAAARGADVDEALATGRLLVLDAEATLARFMVGTMPDERLFRATLESALEAVTGGDRALGVRAYGEMVDVLWRAGNPQGAIRLEELWNDAQRERSFALRCAYVMASFYKEATGLPRVCATHSEVRRPQPPSDPTGNGRPAHLLAAEIAQRVELERTLRECIVDLRGKETQLRDFVGNATIGLHWVGPSGEILWANRAELELLGYEPDEYIGRSIVEFHVDREVISDILRRLEADEALKDYEARMWAKDGSVKHVLIDSSVYREAGRFIHTRCFTRDVTARRAVEEALRESELRLRTIADTLPVLVAHLDEERRYRFANKAYETWFGQPREHILGKPAREVLGDAAYARIEKYVDAALRGETARFQCLVPYQGGERFVDAAYLPYTDHVGRVVGFVGLVSDITEHKRAEQVRDEASRRTQQLLSVTAAIANAVTPDDVYAAIADEVGAAVGASSSALFLLGDDGRHARLARSVGDFELGRQFLDSVALDVEPSFPALDCIRSGEAVWIESPEALLARYPHLSSLVTAGRSYSIASLPIVIDARTVGSIALTFDGAPPIDDAQRDFLLLVTRYSGQALERLRLLAAEQRSRERAQLLSDASRAFAEAGSNIEAVLDAVAVKVTAELATSCAVMLVPERGDVLQVATTRHRDPEATAEVRRLIADQPQRVGEGVIGRVALTGESIFVPHIDRDAILAMSHAPYRVWMERCLPHTLIAVSLRARGAVIGVVTASRQAPLPAFTDDDVRLIEALAERAALAIDSARLQRDDQRARLRAELLYNLAREVITADRIEGVFDAALTAIQRGLGASRASILTYGKDPTMRFRAWRGLSDGYRAAVDGHSPWDRTTVSPEPIVVADVEADAGLAPYRSLFEAENIRALAFIPLVAGQQLVGKFMVYYDAPRELWPSEVELARAIADHVAAALARFEAVAGLQETVRFNEMFTGILGHDLRNPLSAIVTAAQLAMVRSPSERVSKPLSRIVTSSERMSRMIEQLLDFTRVRVGQGIPLVEQSIDLVPVVRQVMEELEDANPAWTLDLEVTGATTGSWDPDRLAQVFSNLVANAIQHGDVSAGVRVRIDGAAPDRVRAEVHNAGVIPDEVLPTIFEPLSGAHRRREGSRGLGLGLHITREIVRAHGGTLGIASEEACGTIFSIELPRRRSS